MIRFAEVSKAFPGVRALDAVSFSVAGGSIHALLGENGAGKSTLLKILSGAYQPDSGQLYLSGQPVRFSHPQDALKAGVAVIYQELNLLPELSVAENIFLGHLPTSQPGWVNSKTLHEATAKALAQVGLDISPATRLGNLSLAQRQMVEIAKALSRNAQVIAFDEPTSSLSKREVETLFSLIQELKAQGRAILYVSHRMDEIFAICDAATVLRDGKHVETTEDLTTTDPGRLVKSMVGRELTDIWGWRPHPIGEIALQTHGVTVHKGEIVGLFGLVGAGRTELLEAIYGNPQASIRKGICLCPEDRKKDGIVAVRSVAENINISARRHFSKLGFWCDDAREAKNAQEQISSLAIKTPTAAQPIGLLSGGNQQKAILGRWLSENVHVLLLDEPTRGIDIGAKREIYEILYNQAENGMAVLLASSELPEVLGICDRILVMREGNIVADLLRDEATPERCLELALPTTSANSPTPEASDE
ncbi:MAG: L-arabinose ABC transporter ATP-binding protein AraG [Armatimonas sp.]